MGWPPGPSGGVSIDEVGPLLAGASWPSRTTPIDQLQGLQLEQLQFGLADLRRRS